MIVPDYQKAQFTLSLDNPFKLTPPKECAFLRQTSHHSASRQEPSSSSVFKNTFDDIHHAYHRKIDQGSALLSLVNSELVLIKKSLLVSAFAGLATVALAIVCWLLVNVLIGALIYQQGVGVLVVLTVLLGINCAATIICAKTFKAAFRHANFTSLIKTLNEVLKH